jgi:hypothetical protein
VAKTEIRKIKKKQLVYAKKVKEYDFLKVINIVKSHKAKVSS